MLDRFGSVTLNCFDSLVGTAWNGELGSKENGHNKLILTTEMRMASSDVRNELLRQADFA